MDKPTKTLRMTTIDGAAEGFEMTPEANAYIRRKIAGLMNSKGRFPTDREVLDMARTDTGPLHAFFTWNEEEAARKYREEQAREIISRREASKKASG